MILYKQITAVAGSNFAGSVGLRMITPLKVKLEGTGFDIVYSPSVPGNRQVAYRSGLGRFTFKSDIVFTGVEKVYILYKL